MPKKQAQRIIDVRRAISASMYGTIGNGAGAIIAPEDRFNKYAATVVAAQDSYGVSKDEADYICDGANDEVEISLAALASGRVILLDGTYNVSAAIVMQHDTEIVGSGPGKCSIRNSGITPTFYSPTLINHFSLKNVRLDCVAPAEATYLVQADMLRCYFERVTFSSALGWCVWSDDAERVRFFDCEFRDAAGGILCGFADEVDILKCRFYKCSVKAVQLEGPLRCKITENTFFYCHDGVVLGMSVA